MHQIAQLHPSRKMFKTQTVATGGCMFTVVLILSMMVRQPAAHRALAADQNLAYLWAAISVGLFLYGLALALIGASGKCPWHTNRLSAWPARWDKPPKWVRR